MPVGEDIPMLIPIAIVLVMFLLFVLSLFTNFSDQQDIVKMSQVSIGVSDYIINRWPTGASIGELNLTKINSTCHSTPECCDFEALQYISPNQSYRIVITITDKSSGNWWCWDNIKPYSKKATTAVVNSFPVLLLNDTSTDYGQVKVSVAK
jgi:hypothetical protein